MSRSSATERATPSSRLSYKASASPKTRFTTEHIETSEEKPHAEAQSPQRKADLYDVSMRPHPRIRKTIKYGGAALTVLLVVVWIGSGWYITGWYHGVGSRGVLHSGGLALIRSRDTHWSVPDEWYWNSRHHPDPGCFHWKIASYTLGSEQTTFIPLWPVTMAAAGTTALAFRLDTLARRRARMNLCVKCHYDRTGLAADAVCPECGTGSGTA